MWSLSGSEDRRRMADWGFRRIIRLVWGAALAGLLGSTASPAAADIGGSTMIIFDGSGSMWGKLAGSGPVKFHAARDAVKAGLAKLTSEARIGLASFGHRRPGDCSDVEVMLPLDKVSVDRIGAPLDKLNPKGRGPLVQALREAAKAMGSGPAPQSLILIHDDPDNCQQDACVAVDEIHAANPRLAIHVVSLGMRPEDAPRMSCVAKKSGGRFFDVQEAAQLTSAVEEALRLSSVAPKTQPQPTAQTARPIAPRAPAAPGPADDAPAGLYPTATLTAAGPAPTAPTLWRVYRGTSTAGVPAAEAIAANPRIVLAPGNYTVEARNGLVTARTNAEVAAKGPTRLLVVLNAAELRLSAPLQKGGLSLPGTLFSVAEPGADGKAHWHATGANPSLVLAPGAYAVTAEAGLARQAREVALTPGAQLDVEVPLGAGRLKLRALDRDGGKPLDPVLVVITEDAPDLAQGRREVTRSTRAELDLVLPGGTYYITARHGMAEIRDIVAIAPGEDVTRSIMIPIARVSLASRLQNGAPAPTDQVFHRLILLDAQPREIARASGAAAEFQLAAGRYRIESQLGGQNALAVREIDVRPGARERITIEHAAGVVRLKLVSSSGKLPVGDLHWDIRNGRDESIWRTVQQEPRAVLAAGRYKVRIESRDRRFESAFEIKTGESRTIEIAVD